MIATLEKIRSTPGATLARDIASLAGASKNYDQVPALRGVNFAVHGGELVALLGPNGAGKTTAVKLLLGLMQPSAGRVRVFGGDPTNPQNRMRVGAMLQVE
jgi:ABC-2 type transport system ATP-binding protein